MEVRSWAHRLTRGARVRLLCPQRSLLIKLVAVWDSPVCCREEKYKPHSTSLTVSLTGATRFILNWKRLTDCNFKTEWLIDQAQKLDRVPSLPTKEGLQIHGEDLGAEQSSFEYSVSWTSTSRLANWILTGRQGFLNYAWQIVRTKSGRFHSSNRLSVPPYVSQSISIHLSINAHS